MPDDLLTDGAPTGYRGGVHNQYQVGGLRIGIQFAALARIELQERGAIVPSGARLEIELHSQDR